MLVGASPKVSANQEIICASIGRFLASRPADRAKLRPASDQQSNLDPGGTERPGHSRS